MAAQRFVDQFTQDAPDEFTQDAPPAPPAPAGPNWLKDAFTKLNPAEMFGGLVAGAAGKANELAMAGGGAVAGAIAPEPEPERKGRSSFMGLADYSKKIQESLLSGGNQKPEERAAKGIDKLVVFLGDLLKKTGEEIEAIKKINAGFA
jgi:hypothetical protein